jgi:hypothetical protein
MTSPAKKRDGQPRIHAAHLTGVIARILIFADGAWAEIVVDGAPNLFREIRVPYPLRNEDGTTARLKEGDRVSILVTPEL